MHKSPIGVSCHSKGGDIKVNRWSFFKFLLEGYDYRRLSVCWSSAVSCEDCTGLEPSTLTLLFFPVVRMGGWVNKGIGAVTDGGGFNSCGTAHCVS